MGIKFLNKILRDNCDQSIWQLNISELRGKKIAVDVSIYLYKYESTDTLLENMYLMLATFRQYDIIPIFIFDGKPPPEKRELLQKRREDKTAAKNEWHKLQGQLENAAEEKNEIIATMDVLKKQFIYITHEKIEKVKDLIRAYGATYYDAPGEADELCAMLVMKKKAWACLSEDMDLFVYGCNRVLRYFSLTNQSIVLYYTKGILENLNMTQKEFREICVLSGTDYNINANTSKNTGINSLTIYDTIKLFRKYQEQKNTALSFYEWLQNAEKNADKNYITDLDLLHKINNMFIISNELTKQSGPCAKQLDPCAKQLDPCAKQLDPCAKQLEPCAKQLDPCANIFKNIKIANGPIQKELIKEIMKEDGFLFIK
jgi:flap endonuclease-1